MLPGYVAGHYAREDELDIDLVRLARFAGARVVLGARQSISTPRPGWSTSPAARRLLMTWLRSTSASPLRCRTCRVLRRHGIPAKPLGRFAEPLGRLPRGRRPRPCRGDRRRRRRGRTDPGHGLCAPKSRGRLAQATLIDSDQALQRHWRQRPARRCAAPCAEQGVRLEENAPDRPHRRRLYSFSQDGREILSDFTTGAAGARPYGWACGTSGLELNDGFIRGWHETLQSSAANVFATGDLRPYGVSPRAPRPVRLRGTPGPSALSQPARPDDRRFLCAGTSRKRTT